MVKDLIADHLDDVFREQFSKETDRAAVILSVAMLDRALETFLRTRLVPISTSKDSLFDEPYSPISTFSAKIDLAYRVALISANFCRNLHLIRRIRNAFAHDVENCSFQNATVRSQIVELMQSSHVAEIYPGYRAKSFPSGARGDFQMAISWMLYWLSCLAVKTVPIENCAPEFCYDRKFREEKRKGSGV